MYDKHANFIYDKQWFSDFIHKVSTKEHALDVINNKKDNKIIHFCFNDVDYLISECDDTDLYHQCITSWVEQLDGKGYEFINWNYDNISIFNDSIFLRYVRAYHYNVAMADYVRFRALHDFGGWYIDCDAIMVRQIDELQNNVQYIIPYQKFHKEDDPFILETAIMFSQPKLDVFKLVVDEYDKMVFFTKDLLRYFVESKPSPWVCKEIFNKHHYTITVCSDLDEYLIKQQTIKKNTLNLLSPLYLGNTVRTTITKRFNRIFLPTPETYIYHMFRSSWVLNKLV